MRVAADDTTVDTLALKLWEYHQMRQPLAPADAILMLGSHDVRVAAHAATLWRDGWAPWLICSGGRGRLTADWPQPEADTFAAIAREMGVPPEAIIVENRSTNTGENIAYTRALLAERGLALRRVLVVQKPYMERRAYATIRQRWPEVEVTVTSPPIAYEDYPNDYISRERLIHLLVGDLQRIRLYPALGYQIPQPIPREVWAAYEELVRLGYTDHLVPESSGNEPPG